MKDSLAFLAASAAFSLHAAAPYIPAGSVSMSQGESSRQVVIAYELQNAPAVVTVDILTNGVSIGAANLTHFAGDVHRVVQPGVMRRMTWRPDKAWPGHEITDQSVSAKVTAWALNAPPDYMVVDLVANDTIDFYVDKDNIPGSVSNDLYKTDKMVFRKCPAANVKWRMGAPTTEPGWSAKSTAHYVSLTNDFYIGIYELTQRQYERITGSTSPAYFSNPAYSMTRPVENTTYMRMRTVNNEAEYQWPSKGHAVHPDSVMGKLRAKVGNRLVFDLPTDAQWEFACRAGTGTGLYTTNEVESACLTSKSANVDRIARYKYTSGYTGTEPPADCTTDYGTATVGSYQPNAWGIYDMYGNVWEYCLDFWQKDLTGVDPETGTTVPGTDHVRRGGAYNSDSQLCRSAYRIEYGGVVSKDSSSGFRVAAVAELAE